MTLRQHVLLLSLSALVLCSCGSSQLEGVSEKPVTTAQRANEGTDTEHGVPEQSQNEEVNPWSEGASDRETTAPSPEDEEVNPWVDPNPPLHLGGTELVNNETWQRLLQAGTLVAQRLNSDSTPAEEQIVSAQARRAIRAVLREGRVFRAVPGKRCLFQPGVALVVPDVGGGEAGSENAEALGSLELCFSCSDLHAWSDSGPSLRSDFSRGRARLLRIFQRLFHENTDLAPIREIAVEQGPPHDPWAEVSGE